ncbi:hypothetical protein LTR17_002163 [Elasticomyces elasticus]|nr:hypothetical protein LTR17_002163 [Elasticomyces elasticus]
MGLLSGKVAIITGGGNETGFGAAIARKFAAEDARILLTDINESGAANVAASIDTTKVKPFAMDVTREADWIRAVKAAEAEFGGLDIVVNNAGTSYRNKPTLDVTEDEFDLVFTVNVKSIFWSAKHSIPQMQAQGRGGGIINISSVGSLRPRPGLVWYSSSKAAVSNATKALASEFGKDQIRVNGICPLLAGTQLFEAFVGIPDSPENRSEFAKAIPLGRLADPKDVAEAAAFFAGDGSKFVTGTLLEVDGGRAI